MAAGHDWLSKCCLAAASCSAACHSFFGSALSPKSPHPASAAARRSAANAVTLRFMVNAVSRSANYTAREPSSREVRVTIPVELAGLRLDQALARLLPEESRSRLARLIEEGHVRVDGEKAPAERKLKSR